jgi:aspartyl protease family protein
MVRHCARRACGGTLSLENSSIGRQHESTDSGSCHVSPTSCRAALIVIGVIAPLFAVCAQPMTSITPRIGETAQEFDARKRGLPPPLRSGGAVIIPRDGSGHFFLDATVNGQRVRMLVDTGATRIALSHKDAELVGLRPEEKDFTQMVSTANGVAAVAPVRLEKVEIGEITLNDVSAVVKQPGVSEVSLLGMSFLGQLKGFEISDGRLLLRQ